MEGVPIGGDRTDQRGDEEGAKIGQGEEGGVAGVGRDLGAFAAPGDLSCGKTEIGELHEQKPAEPSAPEIAAFGHHHTGPGNGEERGEGVAWLPVAAGDGVNQDEIERRSDREKSDRVGGQVSKGAQIHQIHQAKLNGPDDR